MVINVLLRMLDYDPSWGGIDAIDRHIPLRQDMPRYTAEKGSLKRGTLCIRLSHHVWLRIKAHESASLRLDYDHRGATSYIVMSIATPPTNTPQLIFLNVGAAPYWKDSSMKTLSNCAEEFREGNTEEDCRDICSAEIDGGHQTNVSDWWEEFVYLRGRSPIVVNSNFYGLDVMEKPTHIQAARAANSVRALFQFRRMISQQTLKPVIVQNVVPLCSGQFERLFNTTRIPGLETDHVMHLRDSTHIAVYHRGRFFRLPCYRRNRLLNSAELEVLFTRIIEDTSKPCKGEEDLAALTAGESWSGARQMYFYKGMNKTALDAIEKAAFFVTLLDKELDYSMEDMSQLDEFAQTVLTGDGCKMWFDKSFNYVVLKNARVGLNVEHSWADSPIFSFTWEHISDLDSGGYKEDGHCKGEVSNDLPQLTRLKWDVPDECITIIEQQKQLAASICADVDLRLRIFGPQPNEYGKGFIKKCKISPDAYIQMALQLAYYRDSGKFHLTYEASMTRLFREGRTETVRPVSSESCAFVRAMDDPSKTNEERVKLLKAATERHVTTYRDAMTGKGVDRHLFCLYVVSRYLEVDSPFLQEVLGEPWRLSTSQTPHNQTDLWKKQVVEQICPGGGFGPVADDGYGVSYIIASENMLFFHVSSKKSSPTTDSTRFSDNIGRALTDLRTLFQNVQVDDKQSAGTSQSKKDK
ncbi:PREDICTED: carnitine O-palmitoyltransferase 1, liver isoform-like [Priapulus caudatus]|uniref:Carnitine O-palmitoyltransferase 1, liver isoform-like n=1 Tax=Priapulus caudatus TaxID=37621 RepID=A0ABM1EN55_PRICU|nr:PREDICTED: carnitine O-palmitoyltransferase 1, liver isoform-like [Priapulus caudatus]